MPTEQHYQAIASELADIRSLAIGLKRKEFVEIIATRLADIFQNDNSRFDREHFLAVVRGKRPVNSRPPLRFPLLWS